MVFFPLLARFQSNKLSYRLKMINEVCLPFLSIIMNTQILTHLMYFNPLQLVFPCLFMTEYLHVGMKVKDRERETLSTGFDDAKLPFL